MTPTDSLWRKKVVHNIGAVLFELQVLPQVSDATWVTRSRMGTPSNDTKALGLRPSVYVGHDPTIQRDSEKPDI